MVAVFKQHTEERSEQPSVFSACLSEGTVGKCWDSHPGTHHTTARTEPWQTGVAGKQERNQPGQSSLAFVRDRNQ